MSMPLSPNRLFTCTACGATLPVGEDHVGKKCRCGRCGKVSVVGEETPRKEKKSPPDDQYIGFFCRVCDTRMAARSKHVGKKAKCPDCGALTEVPPPPKPRPKQKPKAMHGQQYGLWGVDDAPNPEELVAKQPKFYPVWCRVCDTLMHARENQIGKKLTCPDCGGKTIVPEPPKAKPKKSPLVPDGLEYQLDAAHVLPTRPQQQFKPPKVVEKALEELPPIREERKDRPKVPRVPIIQGVSKMLICAPVTTWFIWLTMVGLCVGGFLLVVVSANPIAAIPFFIAGGLTALLGAGALAALCLSVLTESSEGNDRLYNAPGPVFLDWAADVFYLLIPGVLAFAPSAVLVRAFGEQLAFQHQALLVAAGWLFFFPFFMLSCLENGSALEPFSPRIFGSVATRPGHWLLLVLVSLAVCAGASFAYTSLLTAASQGSLILLLLETPLFLATSLLYFRILGRFAWWLAESLAVEELADE